MLLHLPLLPYGYVFDESQVEWPTMPEPTGETEIAVYECVSEGTPITPPFPDTPEGKLELVSYCAEHCTTMGDFRADEEAWVAILFGDAGVRPDGTVVRES
jgi:hypothetical protein